MIRHLLSALVLGTVVLAAAPAHADARSADALFQEGRRAMGDGRFDDALARFSESEKLDPALGTRMNIALCQEKLGRTATAWALYKSAITDARRAHQSERERVASTHLDELEKRLPRLTIALPRDADVPGLVVRRDGSTVVTPMLAEAVPVDPGAHVVEVTAPGRQPWTGRVVVADGEATRLVVPALPAHVLAPAPAPVSLPPAALPPSSDAMSSRRIVALVLAGAGVTAIGVGAFLGVRAQGVTGDHNDGDDGNNDGDHDGDRSQAEAQALATASTVALVAGGAAIAGAAILFFTGSSDTRTGSVRVAPAVGLNRAGLVVNAAW